MDKTCRSLRTEKNFFFNTHRKDVDEKKNHLVEPRDKVGSAMKDGKRTVRCNREKETANSNTLKATAKYLNPEYMHDNLE